jgi:CRP-like cAMP-binding protein
VQPPVPDEFRGQALLLRRGQVLNLARCQTDQCFRVQQGAIRVCRPLADGRRQITAFLFPGDWVGLEEVHTLGASIEAVTATEVERFSLQMPAGMSPPSFGNVLALRDMLRSRLAAVQSRLLTLGYKNAREKLASFLLEMSDRLADGGDQFALPMSRHDIADYLCLSSETVCRNFTQFMADGIIALPEPKRIQILRRGSLQFLSQ